MALPNFIIAGERRCGTTSLYHILRKHPQVYLPPKADFSYFIDRAFESRDWWDGEPDPTDWESSHTASEYAAMFADADSLDAIGHKTADLLFWRPAHVRMASFVPSVRLIVTLRNPVERAWSHYRNEVQKGRETLSFQNALEQEDERGARSAFARFHCSYRARGFFADSLEVLFRTVPKERVLITTVESLRANRAEVLESVQSFLGLQRWPDHRLGSSERNETIVHRERALMNFPGVRQVASLFDWASEGAIVRFTSDRNRRRQLRLLAKAPFWQATIADRMPDRQRRELAAIYAPSIAKLSDMLSRHFPEWEVE